MAVYTFTANQDKTGAAFLLSSGLGQSFARNVATVAPDAQAVAANKARRDKELVIVAIPEIETVTTDVGNLLASGVDADGVTPLLVHGAYWVNKLYVWAGDPTTTTPNVTTLTTITAGPLTEPFGDDREVGVLTGLAEDLGFEPLCAVVVHGIIVLGGCVWEKIPNDTLYELKGWGFVTNTQQGASNSWQLQWDDRGSPHTQVYNERGRPWVMKAAPIYQRGVGHPTHCAVVCCDYLVKDKTIGQAASGRVYYFRVTRSSTSSRAWAIPTGANGKVKFFDIWPGQRGINGLLNHVLCVMATEWNMGEEEGGGVQLLIATGDGPQHNRLIRARMADYTADYAATSPDPWTITDFYHGTADLPSGPFDPGTPSPQPWNALFGTTEGEILWAGDYSTEWIFKTVSPTDSGTGQAQLVHLFGFASGAGDPNEARMNVQMPCFTQERPELTADNEVMVAMDIGGLPWPHDPLATQRLLYCPDIAGDDTLWAMCT